MKSAYKKLTYKTLFTYSLVIIALLIIAVPVVAARTTGNTIFEMPFQNAEGSSPQTSQGLSSGLNVDHLQPGEERWYVYDQESLGIDKSAWVSLALRYQSEGQINTEQANFEVFSQAPQQSWFNAENVPQEYLGLGLRSPLQPGQNSIESFWSGEITDHIYYVHVFNYSPFGLDYTLEARPEQPTVSGAIPASTGAAIGNPRPLNARQMAWTLTAQAVENMDAIEAAVWMKEAQVVGWLVTQETVTENIPQPDAASPQLLWKLTAQAIEGQDAQTASQWLIQADSLGWLSIPMDEQALRGASIPAVLDAPDETGPVEPAPIEPVQPEDETLGYEPVNIYPNNPLPMNLSQVNSGRLGPYGEHWYLLSQDDMDDDMIEEMRLTMFFTPRVGYISNRINFEIFPANQYHIWARGDADYMENLGLGMWISRDEDPDTGERLWSGTLVDRDQYLVKVKNGTADVVDYYLFPDDVENAELGNPLLHASDEATGHVPYPISPPTRVGR